MVGFKQQLLTVEQMVRFLIVWGFYFINYQMESVLVSNQYLSCCKSRKWKVVQLMRV